MSKSPLKWAGGKGKLLPQIIPLLPKEYNRYIEPFAGGLSLFFNLRPEKALIYDINEELINFYTVLRDNLSDLIEALKKHDISEKYYFEIRDVDLLEEYKSWSNIDRASRFLFLNKTCWNGLYRVNSKGHFNVPYGKRKNPKIIDEPVLKRCSNILKRAELFVGDFKEVMVDAAEGDFVYLDPPYVPLSNTASFTSYTKEDFNEKDQHRLRGLCTFLSSAGCKWALSNSDTTFVRQLYKGNNINIIEAPRFINSKGDGRGKITEVLVTNYGVEKPTKFFWEM